MGGRLIHEVDLYKSAQKTSKIQCNIIDNVADPS